MAELSVSHPAAPAEEGSTHGGFADIARRLNALHPERQVPISRQLVERWYKCRSTNEFPERHPVELGDGKIKVLFDLLAVDQWHMRWIRKRQPGGPPIETIPLFQVDRRGHPVHPVDAEGASYRGHPEVRENYRNSILDL